MSAGRLKFVTSGCSDTGVVREENEDSLLIREPTEPEQMRKKGILIALADGMGGLDEGSMASRMAVEVVARAYYDSSEEPRAALEAAVKEANRSIFEHSRTIGGGRNMGSTLTAVAVIGSSGCIAQVGDSRAYCYRDGTIHQVTRDHSLVRELVDMGRIEEASPHYAFHRNVLTRGLGLREDVAVDLYEIQELEPGDRILVSSDGLHELVRPEEMAVCLEKHGADPEAASRELVSLARGRGGPDNITVAISYVLGEQGAAGPRRSRGLPFAKRVESPPGWFLPIAVFGSFVLGVVLTLLVEAPPPLSREEVRLIQTELKALEDEIGRPGDAERARERVKRLEEMMEGGR